MSNSQSIEPAQITQQVERILKTPSFKSSRVLSGFLKFIVTETMEGNEHTLKEYVIATNVLKKDSDFNPQLDAIVRIHARRLRNLLNDYNEKEGKNDPIKIYMPKGRYIPIFEKVREKNNLDSFVAEDHKTVQENIPQIAIIPFKNHESENRVDVICSVLVQELVVELSRFPEIGVLSNYSTQYAIENIQEMDKVKSHLGADYLITGSCLVEANNINVFVELHSVLNNQILWAESYQIEDYKKSTLKSFKLIIKKILAFTCGYFGIIYRNILNAHIPQDFDYLYAIYWHNRYHRNYSEEAFNQALRAIDFALEKNPDNSLLNSFKAQLLLDLCTMDIQGDIDYFNAAFSLVQRSLQLDPVNQHGLQILAWAYIIDKDREKSVLTMEKCLSVNPNDSMFMSTIGFGYICVGEYENGLNLISESINLNPYGFWLMNVGFCYYFIHVGEYDEALYWAKKIKKPGLIWDHLLCISLNGLIETKEDLSEPIEILYNLSPNFNQRAPFIVDAFLFDKKLQKTILDGLKMSGLPIEV